MKKLLLLLACAAAAVLLFVKTGLSHCQVPCGIYDDEMRFEMINEDILTIEKSINEISKLSGQDIKNYNQLIRWVSTKDKHADNIISIAGEYFLAQRISLNDNEKDKKYLDKLILLHQITVYSMKTKQSTDTVNIEKLKASVNDFKKIYFEKK